jgi:alpha-galactosidase
MNRNFSDLYTTGFDSLNQGKLIHSYYLGLYNLLERLTNNFPNILFESCASGGNRFDLGMLYYMPQIWTSDNTDAYSRYLIQSGTYFGYSQSVMGNHVSDIPSAQVIRKTPLETRFNLSAFGLLGYELDITKLTPFETKVIKKQIVMAKDKSKAILGTFQILQEPSMCYDVFKLPMLDKNKTYKITKREQFFNLDMFGHLIKHALPIRLNSKGLLFHLLKNRYLFKTEEDTVIVKGDILVNNGFIPKQRFIGTGYNESIRLMGDFGSRLYYIEEIKS